MLLCAVPAPAQTSTGSVYGSVTDEQGSPIPGATATLIGPPAPRVASADVNGRFRFLRVAPGRYSITLAAPGFASLTQENVIVSVGRNTQVDFRMALAGVNESVTVTSEPPLIDTRTV